MSIKPINLDGIQNDNKFRLVAFLVDRDDFLSDIEQARKLLGLSKLIPSREVHKWKTAHIKERVDIILEQIEKISFPRSITGDDYKKPPIDIKSFNQRFDGYIPSDNYQAGLNYFLAKYKRPPVYLSAIEHALLSGVVTDADFKNVEIFISNQQEFSDYLLYFPSILIYVNPNTELKEIQQVCRERFDQVSQEYAKAMGIFYKASKIGDIKIIRGWYWLKIEGLTWIQIHQQAIKNKETTINWGGVREAVKRYKKILTQKI